MDLPADVARLAAEQRGLLRLTQLADGGVARAQVRWALGRTWRIALPRVVATFTGELDAGQRLIAGRLWAGQGSQIAGLTAARWHGFTGLDEDGLVRLLVDWGVGMRREGFAVRRRTTRLDPRPWQRGPLVICSRARALVDAAREMQSPDQVRHVLLAGVQRRLVRESDLRAELEAGPLRGSATTRRALRDVATGAWSSPEADVLRELGRSTVLPRVWPNPILVAGDGTVLPSPDYWLDDVGLAGQVHSRAHHLLDDQWDSTVAADTVYGEYGIPLISVTPSGFRRDPAGYRRRVERAYLAARRLGRRPDVAMRPRGPGMI